MALGLKEKRGNNFKPSPKYLKLIKEKLDLAKLEYADEVSAAKENAQNELSKIREETKNVILEAIYSVRKKILTEWPCFDILIVDLW